MDEVHRFLALLRPHPLNSTSVNDSNRERDEPTPLGFWGESFRIDEDGRLAVTNCNGDHVALEDDQWRHVVTLLTTNLERSQSTRASKAEAR